MFTVAIALIPFIVFLLFLGLHLNAKRYNRPSLEATEYTGGWFVGMTVSLFFVLFFTGLSFIKTMNSYSDQVSDFEDIKKFEQIAVVYENRATALTAEFTKLAMDYLGHEKVMFDKMSPGDVMVYMVKYPELNSSKNIRELVDQIRSMQDDVYKQQVEIEKTKKNIRYRLRNPWIFYQFIPTK